MELGHILWMVGCVLFGMLIGSFFDNAIAKYKYRRLMRTEERRVEIIVVSQVSDFLFKEYGTPPYRHRYSEDISLTEDQAYALMQAFLMKGIKSKLLLPENTFTVIYGGHKIVFAISPTLILI